MQASGAPFHIALCWKLYVDCSRDMSETMLGLGREQWRIIKAMWLLPWSCVLAYGDPYKAVQAKWWLRPWMASSLPSKNELCFLR